MLTVSSEGLRALCGTLVAITTVIAFLRFYTRRIQRATLEADDWLILPGYVTFIGMVACALLGVHLGQFGYSERQLAAFHLSFSVQASLVNSLDILSAASLGFTRINALLFYRRMFCVPGRSAFLRAVIYGSITVISLWMVAFVILPPLQCGPNLSVWSVPAKVRAAQCIMGNKIILALCISDLLIELFVIAMPIPKILQLKTSLRRRLVVLFVFLTAFVSLGAVIARRIITTKLLDNRVEDKSQANTTQTFMWILEAGFALIAVNLPSLWWLRQKTQPGKVLASLQSAISFRSTRSNNSDSVLSKSHDAHIGWRRGNRSGDPYSISQTGVSSREKLPRSSHIGMVPLSDAEDGRWVMNNHSEDKLSHVPSLAEDTMQLRQEIHASAQVV